MTLNVFISMALAIGAMAADSVAPTGSDGSPGAVLRKALTNYETAVAMKTSTPEKSREFLEQAAAGFRDLIESGHNSSGLQFNLANTYVRLGRIGPAIVNYRRALRLEPGNDRIQRNLDFARSRCQSPIPPAALSQFANSVFSWHFNTAFSARLTLALISYSLFWVLLIVGRQFIHRAPFIGWLRWAVACLAVVLWASVAVDSYRRSHVTEGVLTANNVVLRKGYGENYDPQLDRALSEGVEVRIRETREDVEGRKWYYVELSDGKFGWLRADQCTII